MKQPLSETDRMPGRLAAVSLRRSLTIGFMAFLTVVDLFGTQAILPTLARTYDVSPAMMGVAVNATTFGMAFAGLGSDHLQPSHRPPDRRGGQPAAAGHSDRRC